MYTCICRAVTQTEVRSCINNSGATTVDEVGDHCGAGTGCGMCHDRIQAMLLAHRQNAAASSLAIAG